MQKYTIGRAPDNDIVIYGEYVSSHHAVLVIREENGYRQIMFTDHSSNGTVINGQKLHNSTCYVAFGDSIIFPGYITFDWSVLKNSNETTIIDNLVKPDFDVDKEEISFGSVLKRFYNHYTDFSGRARRREYWYVVLWFFIITVICAVLLVPCIVFSEDVGGYVVAYLLSSFYGIFMLASVIPMLALTIRRIHDMGKPGWWYFLQLIPLAGFVFKLIIRFADSENKNNQWGPCPK